MPQLRIIQTVTEFGRSLSAGALDPVGLTPLQELALVLSGMAEFVGNPDVSRMPDDGVVPITTVMLASPAAYGLNFSSARTYECNGVRYFWNSTLGTMVSAGGFTPAQVQAINDGRLLAADGSLMAAAEVSTPIVRTATGLVLTGRCAYAGFIVRQVTGTVNILVYDGTSATGNPYQTVNSIAVGPYPVWGPNNSRMRANSVGVFASWSGGGTAEIEFHADLF